MAAVLVDSCVLLDLITADPRWEAWSAEQLSEAFAAGPVWINPLIYAEVAYAYARIEDVDAVLPRHLYDYRPLPREADFLIGAHAVIEQVPMLTRDVRRYRQAYPGLKLIAPG